MSAGRLASGVLQPAAPMKMDVSGLSPAGEQGTYAASADSQYGVPPPPPPPPLNDFDRNLVPSPWHEPSTGDWTNIGAMFVFSIK